MYKVENHRFALNTYLYGGKRLAYISSNNYWTDPSYKALIEIENGIEGDFIPSGSATTPQWGGYDIIVPEDGYYNIIIDFITGQYKLTPIPSLLSTPEELYIIGDATILEWNVPNDAQKFEKIDETTFSIKVQLFSNKNYAFITSASTWSDPAYIMPIGNISEECINTGLIIASGEGNNWQGVQMQSPSITGTYNILVNFKSGVFVVSL